LVSQASSRDEATFSIEEDTRVRLAIPVGYALSAAAAVALLAGCAGGGSQLAPTPAGQSGQKQMSSHRGFPAGKVVAAIPNGQNIVAHPSKVKSFMSPQVKITPVVYVSDFSAGTVSVFDQKGKNQTAIGVISGLANPQGEWVQRASGDLYVVQSGAALITGYHRGSTTSFISLNDSSVGAEAVSVAFTPAGDGYVAHLGSNIISHYAPGATTPTDTFTDTNASSTFFITADTSGELFITYFDSGGIGRVDEIVAGTPTQLPITLSFPGGIQLDKNENLLVDDQLVPSISTYAPPYSSVLSSFTLTGDPVNFSLSGIGWAVWDANAVNLAGERYAYSGPGGTNPNAPNGTLIESTSTSGFSVPISAYCDKARPT
jgi:hypothetical protein